MSNQPLIIRHRPNTFAEVRGNDEAVAALQRRINDSRRPHAYLFTGPSGVGKTTIARLVGITLDSNVIEVDAASNNGVDAMRQLVEMGHYMVPGAQSRLVILDECFAPGTLVNTPTGKKPIERLCVGDAVLNAHGTGKVAVIAKKLVPLTHIIRLHLENETTILCSKFHPFLTSGGWVHAQDLQNAQRFPLSIQSDIPSALLKMWDSVFEQGRGYRADMPNLSAKPELLVLPSHVYLQAYQSNLLYPMCQQESGRTTARRTSARMAAGAQGSHAAAYQFGDRDTVGTAVFETDDGAQSYARSSRYPKDDQHEENQRHIDSEKTLAGRKWSWPNQSTDTTSPDDWWSARIPSFARCSKARIPNSLQNRFSSTGNPAGDRDRRSDPQQARAAATRSEENGGLVGIRVDHITPIEQGDIDRLKECGHLHIQDDTKFAIFYDLTIEGHPSYIVEDLLVHNCHMLSKAAWNAALKILEEPPEHLYLALCTTELYRVPETVITRCHHIPLVRLPDTLIAELLIEVLDKENWTTTILDDVFQLIVHEAQGSPRRALSLLQAVYDAPSLEEARRIIAIQGSANPMIQILNIVISGQGGWDTVRPMLMQISDDDFSEGTVIQACRYIIGAMNREESEQRARRIWDLLAYFLYPAHSYDPKSVFYAAIGRILWSSE